MPTSHSRAVDKHGVLSRRPRLLFLACYFPPAQASGSVRAWNIAKYLTRLGWDVTVVTPQPSLWRHVDDPTETEVRLEREGINRILTGYRWRCLEPDQLNCWNQGLGWLAGGVCRKIVRRLGIASEIGWIKAAEQACSTLTESDVDVILATGSPFLAFRLAKRLAERLGRPYVLDYRDPWTANPHSALPARSSTIHEEAGLLAGCGAVTVVSRTWGSAMADRFGLGRKLHVVMNGYDPEELSDITPCNFGHFAIIYAGTFYPPKRVITPLMAALSRLKTTLTGKGGQWYFHYYGGQEDHVREEAQRFGLIEKVVLHGRVARTQVLSALKGAGVTVVITSVSEKVDMDDRGIIPGKIFETLGLGSPVLLVAPPGSDIETVVETTGGVRRFCGSDIDGIASFLADAMCGQPSKPQNVAAYTWTNIAKKLDLELRCLAVGASHNKSETSA